MKHWLFGDRIRVSNTEGQWLRLDVGQRVIVDDRLLVIISREVLVQDKKTGVRYSLVDHDIDAPPLKTLRDAPLPLLIDNFCQIQLQWCGTCLWMDCFCENG